MMKRLLFILLLALTLSPLTDARERQQKVKRDTLAYPDSYLDTVKVGSVFSLNDYSMIGIHGGVGFSMTRFRPKYTTEPVLYPEYYGITFSKYGKMFGSMPYFGFEIGLFYGHEGYKMKYNEELGTVSTISGADQVKYDVVEIPYTAMFHYDLVHFRLTANVGLYGAYRLNIQRYGGNVAGKSWENDFLETDRQPDYGLKGGIGMGFVFDPFELHIRADARYSWQNLYEPDYLSPYVLSFAYPLDIMVSAGLYFQLGKRSGKNKAALKKDAYNIVYGPEEPAEPSNTMPWNLQQ